MVRTNAHVMTLVLVVLSLAVFATELLAAETKKAQAKRPPGTRMRISGSVEVTRTTAGAISRITVTSVNNVVYDIVQDERAKALTAAFGGKRAWALGYCVISDSARTFTVESFGDLAKKPKPESKKKAGSTKKRK